MAPCVLNGLVVRTNSVVVLTAGHAAIQFPIAISILTSSKEQGLVDEVVSGEEWRPTSITRMPFCDLLRLTKFRVSG